MLYRIKFKSNNLIFKENITKKMMQDIMKEPGSDVFVVEYSDTKFPKPQVWKPYNYKK